MNNDHVARHFAAHPIRNKTHSVRPPLTCADGFSMSVQASTFHYCTPSDDLGPYSHVEVGYPSATTPELYPYADGSPGIAEVFAYVPVAVVNAIIDKHGGPA